MKKHGGIVYSTNKNFKRTVIDENKAAKVLEKNQFILSVCFEKKGRGGKGVTIIKGFQGSPQEMKKLNKEIKQLLAVGGSLKNNEIILQGRIQDKVIKILNKKGYMSKKVGG